MVRVCDAMKLQISSPLQQVQQSQLQQYDPAQMLDIVLAYKQVALDILEQLRQPPAPSVPSIFVRTTSTAKTPNSRKTRARIDSVQQDAETRSIQQASDLPHVDAEDFADQLPVRTISRATTVSLSADSNATDSRRPSVMSATSTNPTSPSITSPTTIASLSARLNSRSTTPAHSRTPSRRANVPDPLKIPPPGPAIASIGTMLHASMTTPTPGPSRPPAVKRNNSAYGQSSGALLAGLWLPPDHSQHQTPSTSHAHEDPHMPTKANHWHGFCKGAWTARQDAKKSFATHIVPVGMYGRKEQWRCKDCHFTGNISGTGKHKTFDDRVFVDAETGIQFKWIFLAKSHMKVKEKGMEIGPTFGCTECVEEGETTLVYGDAHALLGHIAEAHPDGVKAAIRPPDPFWQGAIITSEGDWDLYMPLYSDATTPLSPSLTWN